MSQDYILMARVKGFGKARIVWREAFANALVPTVTLVVLKLAVIPSPCVLQPPGARRA